MRFIDYITLAFRNLWRRKLRTFLTVLAVVIGVVAVVTLVSIALGARNAFIGQLESIGALSDIYVIGSANIDDVNIFGGTGGLNTEDPDAIKLTDGLIADIEKIDNVAYVAPRIGVHQYETMIIDNRDGESKRLRGNIESIYVPDDRTLIDLPLAAGRFFDSADQEHAVILGYNYIRQLHYADGNDVIGTEVTFQSHEGVYGYDDALPDPDADETVWRTHRSEVTATVIGVTPPGPNARTVYMPTEWAKKLNVRKKYAWPDEDAWKTFNAQLRAGLVTRSDEPQPVEITETDFDTRGYDALVVRAADVQLAEELADTIKEKFNVSAFTAQDFLEDILNIFRIIEIVLGIIGSIALGVAAIGIVNTMIMSIYERTREIGVMKAVGASRGAIRWLFTFEASMMGFLGGSMGLLAGWLLSLLANNIANRFLAADNIPLTDIIELPPYLMVGVLAFSTVIGTLAGLYPATRAAKLDPILALHQE